MNKKIINKYFREFVLRNKDVISFEEHSYKIIQDIEKRSDTDFHKNWNYLMVLIQIIENLYSVSKIITHDNYVGFEFTDETIQDKGYTKLEAYYLVCFKTLLKFWVEGKTTEVYLNMEPFDEFDLK